MVILHIIKKNNNKHHHHIHLKMNGMIHVQTSITVFMLSLY